MNMIKLKHKPSGRYLTISEAHALSLLKGGKEYIEVPIEEGIPEVVKVIETPTDPVVVGTNTSNPTSKKKAKKKTSKKS